LPLLRAGALTPVLPQYVTQGVPVVSQR
jgi:hypothetical protein